MSACYWVLISDSLFGEGIMWPPGLRLAGPEAAARYPVRPQVPHVPASAWRLIEDDGADPGLDGRRAEVVLHFIAGVPEVMTRSEVT